MALKSMAMKRPAGADDNTTTTDGGSSPLKPHRLFAQKYDEWLKEWAEPHRRGSRRKHIKVPKKKTNPSHKKIDAPLNRSLQRPMSAAWQNNIETAADNFEDGLAVLPGADTSRPSTVGHSARPRTSPNQGGSRQRPSSQSASRPVSHSSRRPVSQSSARPVSQSSSRPTSQSGNRAASIFFELKNAATFQPWSPRFENVDAGDRRTTTVMQSPTANTMQMADTSAFPTSPTSPTSPRTPRSPQRSPPTSPVRPVTAPVRTRNKPNQAAPGRSWTPHRATQTRPQYTVTMADSAHVIAFNAEIDVSLDAEEDMRRMDSPRRCHALCA